MTKIYECNLSGYIKTTAIPILSNTSKANKLTEVTNNTVNFTDHITAIANPNCQFGSSHTINFVHFDSSKSMQPEQSPNSKRPKTRCICGGHYNSKTLDRHVKSEKHRRFLVFAKYL